MKIIYSIIIIFIFGSNAYAMDKYFGAPNKITDWRISCSVDKGSIVDNYPNYIFKTSKNRCSGGTYNQRAEIATRKAITLSTKAKYNFQTIFSITDGEKRFKMKIGDYSSFINIAINDTSRSLFYNLFTDKSVVSEGENFTITLVTNDEDDINYVITGIELSDINGLSMTGLVSDFTDTSDNNIITYTKTISITNDINTEGPEVFKFSLSGTRETTNGIINLSILHTRRGQIFSQRVNSIVFVRTF